VHRAFVMKTRCSRSDRHGGSALRLPLQRRAIKPIAENRVSGATCRRHDVDCVVLRLALPCSPCYSRHCSHQSCLKWLEIDPVLQLAEEQMNAGGAIQNS